MNYLTIEEFIMKLKEFPGYYVLEAIKDENEEIKIEINLMPSTEKESEK